MGKIFVSKKLVAINVPLYVKKLLSLLLSTYLFSCNAQLCSQLPQSFESYKQAISLIRKSSFIVEESANTFGNSWISSAKYYSCDGTTGYFVLKINNGKEYIHNGVPIAIWMNFKDAFSKGSYYDYNIRNRFSLTLK